MCLKDSNWRKIEDYLDLLLAGLWLTKFVGPIYKKSTWQASQLECTSFLIDHGFERRARGGQANWKALVSLLIMDLERGQMAIK